MARLPLALAFASVLLIPLLGARGASLYPEGYRTWTHVKSMVIEKGHPLFELVGGLHHIYANPEAMAGYTSEPLAFPDGATIVFDLLEAVHADDAISEGARKALLVMRKDSATFADTGGWGFAMYPGDARLPAEIDAAACFSCHQQVEESDFVFSRYRP